MKKRIGIVTSFDPATTAYTLHRDYITSVRAAGGVPVLLTLEQGEDDLDALFRGVDALLLPGGPDVSPLLYGEDPIREVKYTVAAQDRFEIALTRRCVELGKPILGICRGAQVLNVALGGTLYQDIFRQGGASVGHQQNMKLPCELTHRISVTEGTRLHKILGQTSLAVNSFHHQAVKELAPGLVLSAVAGDGIIEGFESPDLPILGVQFHPENLSLLYPHFLELFRFLTE